MANRLSGIEELFENEDFVRWVLKPDEAGDLFWEAWLRQYPEKAGILEKAKEWVLLVYGSEKQDGETLKNKNIAPRLWERIKTGIDDEMPPSRVIPLHPGSFSSQRPLRKKLLLYYGVAAAAIAGLILAGGWLFQGGASYKNETPKQAAALVVHASGNSNLECVNTGALPQPVYLVDGTRILLGGNSSLRYEKFLNKDRREVILEGEAFFDVVKDAVRPFYVHTRGLVTRVLGTSFRIIARKEDEKITVAVKTGKVGVRTEQPDTKDQEYILQANQEVVFNQHLQAAGRPVVADSELLQKTDLPDNSFSFSDAPVGTILNKLSQTYSVTIVYDKQSFSKCQVTVSLDALSLTEKLDLLCKILGVRYRIEDDKVYMEGKGCQ
ncbi:MAG: FecR domain-containing protein [Puia sp.]|nr:FecR domain-containing protein [Puia sp.]